MEFGISMGTVKFIAMLEELARLSEGGIRPFSRAIDAETLNTCIVYDTLKKNADGTHLVPLYLHLDSEQPTVITNYNTFCGTAGEYHVGVVIEEDGTMYVVVKTGCYEIIVDDGRWYFS